VIGDHLQVSDGKAVVSSGSRGGTCPTCSLPDEAYVMAKMWLEINTASADLEKVSSLVFQDCVVTVRTAQATLDVGLVCIAASRGSLRKTQRGQ
jgi:hypothetical protein